MRGNRFLRPHRDKPDDIGGSYGIAKHAVIWIGQSKGVELKDNLITEPGPFGGEAAVVQSPKPASR